jgi:hypothetical protein
MYTDDDNKEKPLIGDEEEYANEGDLLGMGNGQQNDSPTKQHYYEHGYDQFQ